MQVGQYLSEFKLLLDKMLDITTRKGHDYCSASGAEDYDPFFNFRQVEKAGITSVEKGILVRMTDKMSRIVSLLDKEAKVKDESIEDTLVDLANYSLILLLYRKHGKTSSQEDVKTAFNTRHEQACREI